MVFIIVGQCTSEVGLLVEEVKQLKFILYKVECVHFTNCISILLAMCLFLIAKHTTISCQIIRRYAPIKTSM